MDRGPLVRNAIGVLALVTLHPFVAIVLTASELRGPPYSNLWFPTLVCLPFVAIWFVAYGRRHVRLTVFGIVTMAALIWFVWTVVIPFRSGPYPLL